MKNKDIIIHRIKVIIVCFFILSFLFMVFFIRVFDRASYQYSRGYEDTIKLIKEKIIEK